MKNIVNSLIVIIIALVAASCGHKDNAKKEETAHTTALKLYTLAAGNVGEDVRLPGILQPFEEVQIYPKVNGFIKDMNVDRGSVVHKGQVLMTLEAPELEQKMSAAKLKYVESVSNLQTSKDKYKRLLQTSKTPGTVSAYDLEAADSKMMADSAVVQGELANYDAQRTMYSYLTVTAPFDGIITERNVHPGALVGPGAGGSNKPMLILQQQNLLRLVANVPEQYSAQITDGEEVHFKINAIPGKDFTGKISRSSGSLSEHFRAETVEIDVQNPNDEIKGGMYAEVSIPASGSANAFKVPKSAVVVTDERVYVLAIVDGKTKIVNVTQGNEAADGVEVFGDLKQGEQVVANANYDMKEGTAVNS